MPNPGSAGPAGSATRSSGQHRDRRFGAIGLHVVALLMALISLSVISRWFIIATALGWMLAAGSSTDSKGTDPEEARR
ncbi:hypothetical protein ACWF2L_12220 [Streptomyces anulatus]